jgi:hypothetical protein
MLAVEVAWLEITSRPPPKTVILDLMACRIYKVNEPVKTVVLILDRGIKLNGSRIFREPESTFPPGWLNHILSKDQISSVAKR